MAVKEKNQTRGRRGVRGEGTPDAMRQSAEKRVDALLAAGGPGTGTKRGETMIQTRERLIQAELSKQTVAA